MALQKLHVRLQCTNAFDKGEMYPIGPYLHFSAVRMPMNSNSEDSDTGRLFVPVPPE